MAFLTPAPVVRALFCALFMAVSAVPGTATQKVLVAVEGRTDLTTPAMGDGRHLQALLGHFDVEADVIGVDDYTRGRMGRYDRVFYIGFNVGNTVPRTFTDDVAAGTVPVVWIHTGFLEFSATGQPAGRYGFTVTGFDSSGVFRTIEHGPATFTKEEPMINLVAIHDRARARVVATAVAARTGRRIPYIVTSGNLTYIADSPFSLISPSDRYMLFADMLHDMLGEEHPVAHPALIRIEDVNPLEDPDKLRDVADVLSSRGIPFLVGVSPFYVDPSAGLRVSLSDKPEIVDALQYMVRNGGTIVMHGVTHQYRGTTGADYEFWDENTDRPIDGETAEGVRRKIEMGLHEFMKNGLYPLVWETPHYTGSFTLYRVIGDYFDTAMEQRLAIERSDYSQFYPYIIHRDPFGQMIYPENLGYIPLLRDPAKAREHVRGMIADARATLSVRDGFAASFFHAFVDVALLEELVDSVRAMGYTYMDVRDDRHRVQLRDRVILTGSQTYTVTLEDQYLAETVYDHNGEVIERRTSDERMHGRVTRSVTLEPGRVYKAEPVEFRERERTPFQQAIYTVRRAADRLFGGEEPWQEARPVILWNQYARGAAYNDQASFAALFASVSIPVDTIFIGQPLTLAPYNIVVVPFGFIDSLRMADYDALVRWVEGGGSLITDTHNYLVEELGVRSSTHAVAVTGASDRLFPETRIQWRSSESMLKIETGDEDEVFCTDSRTDAPLVIGTAFGKGKVLFIGTRFDPHTPLGYSHYPFMLEYIRTFFGVAPVLRNNALEMFFDPGFRTKQSIEHLVQLWVRQGIRRIHVAGWHIYPKYTYDYARLIALAHANGILVYAWLEPPQVSQKFWLEHPEWREKNHRGEDVRPSWRYPVALTEPRARAAMLTEYRTFLERYDWDGVNLAELYFEAGKGLQDPALFTPMHPSAQSDLHAMAGIDAAGLFDPRSPWYWRTNAAAAAAVTEYRVDMLDRVYRELLPVFDAVGRTRPGFEVIVTAMDALGSPELRGYIGVDMERLLALQKEFGFALQVEDPEHRWSSDPMRYEAMGETYAARLGGRDHLLLDLNILSFRNPDTPSPFPTTIQTGTECFHLVRAAALGAPRATIYAESSVNAQDMPWLASASAAAVRLRRTENGYLVDAPHHVSLRLPPEVREITLDGEPFAPVRDNQYLIPAGQHTVALSTTVTGSMSPHMFFPRLLSISGNLLAQRSAMRTLEFTYRAGGRCIAMIDREVHGVTVDGVPYRVVAWKGNDGYSLLLPEGMHRVEVVAGDAFSYGLNLASFWSSTAIALFGLASVLTLLVMYAIILIRRRVLAVSQKGLNA